VGYEAQRIGNKAMLLAHPMKQGKKKIKDYLWNEKRYLEDIH
jgi:hypothetical protein